MIAISLNQVLNLIYKSLDDAGKQMGVTDSEVQFFQKVFEEKYYEFDTSEYLFFGQTEQNYASNFDWWYNYYEYNFDVYKKKPEVNNELFSLNYEYNNIMLFYELYKAGFSAIEINKLILEVRWIFWEYYQSNHANIYIHNTRTKPL